QPDGDGEGPPGRARKALGYCCGPQGSEAGSAEDRLLPTGTICRMIGSWPVGSPPTIGRLTSLQCFPPVSTRSLSKPSNQVSWFDEGAGSPDITSAGQSVTLCSSSCAGEVCVP